LFSQKFELAMAGLNQLISAVELSWGCSLITQQKFFGAKLVGMSKFDCWICEKIGKIKAKFEQG